jgi:hypothetical protein
MTSACADAKRLGLIQMIRTGIEGELTFLLVVPTMWSQTTSTDLTSRSHIDRQLELLAC